jgi:hypothetical protein
MTKPSIAVLYCYPTPEHGAHHADLALKFVSSYLVHPPEFPCDLIPISNGGPPNSFARGLFEGIPDFKTWLVHDDTGYDIGAFQIAARSLRYDLAIFLGGSSYIRGKGWVNRIAQAYEHHGMALYGAMGHGGDPVQRVKPHIRSTGFWCPPGLLNRYPHRVTKPEQRYPFEHGDNCFTQWVSRQGIPVLVVTWSGEFGVTQTVPNGYHNGDQSELLLGDRLSQPPFHGCP